MGGGGGGDGGPGGGGGGGAGRGPHGFPLGHDFGFGSFEFGHCLGFAELKQIALAAIQLDVLHLGQEIQAQGGIDGQGVDLIFLALGAQRGMKLVAARAVGTAQLARGGGRLGDGGGGRNGRGGSGDFGGGAFPLRDGGGFRRRRGGGIGEEGTVDGDGRHHAEHGERVDRLFILGTELHCPAPWAAGDLRMRRVRAKHPVPVPSRRCPP